MDFQQYHLLQRLARHGSTIAQVSVVLIILLGGVSSGVGASPVLAGTMETQPHAQTGTPTPPSNQTGTMGTVTLVIQDGRYFPVPGFPDKRYNFKLIVTKLNKSTFVAIHRHGPTTKKWYFPNVSSNHVNDLWKTDQHAGWSGRLGEHTDKEQLAKQIADTKIYREQIRPFMTSKTHKQKEAGVDQPGVDIPSFDPVENFEKLVKAIMGIPGKTIDVINDIIFGIPAPGQPDKPKTWLDPQNQLWPGVSQFSHWMGGLAALIFVFTGGMTFFHTDAYERRQAWKRWFVAFFMALTTWTLLPMVLHLANGFSVALRPDSTEIFKSWGSITKVGTGLGVLAVVAFLQPAIVGIGAFVLAVERFLIYATVGFWPLAWALRSTSNALARSLGEWVVYLFAVTLATKLGQAMIARLLFSLDWAGLSLSSLMMLIMVGAGVLFMLIIFPRTMLKHASRAGAVSLGVSAGMRASGRASEKASAEASKRVGQVADRVIDWRRESEPESSIPYVGRVGRGHDDPDRPDDYNWTYRGRTKDSKQYQSSHGPDPDPEPEGTDTEQTTQDKARAEDWWSVHHFRQEQRAYDQTDD